MSRNLRKSLWCLLFGGAVGLFYLGWQGYVEFAPEKSLSDSLFASVRLFFLEGTESGGIWQLEVARWLAPVLLAYSAILGFAILFRERWQEFCLGFRRDHVIVCGIGDKGLQLVKDFTAQGAKVIAVEIDKSNPNIPTCWNWGATVIVADATQAETLKKVRANRAGTLIATSNDDNTNIDIAFALDELVRRVGRKQGNALKCFFHFADSQFCRLFRQHDVFQKKCGPLDISLFNVIENGARLLFAEHPLDYVEIGPEDSRQVHLVVVGFDTMGESVVLQAIKTGHFANGKPLKISVIDTDATRHKSRFLTCYSDLASVVELQFYEGGTSNCESISSIRNWVGDADLLTTFVLCNNEVPALVGALNILAHIQDARVRVYVYIPGRGGIENLLRNGQSLGQNLIAFGMVEDICTAELVVQEQLDRLARIIHASYVDNRMKSGEPPESRPALFPWEKLGSDFIDSSRQQADHLSAKIRALGYRSISEVKASFTNLTDEQVETLAQMEHARWCAERLLGGWSFGMRDDARRKHPNLVSWQSLPESAKDLDREAVCKIPSLLALVKKRLP